MSFLKASKIPFKITDGDSAIIGFPLGGPISDLSLAEWAVASGATTIFTLEDSTPFLGIGDPTPGTPVVGANVLFAADTVVQGCSGKLIVSPADTSSFYYIFTGDNADSYGTDASRSLLTVVRSNAVAGLGSYECAMSSGGTYVATDLSNFALQGFSVVAGECKTLVNNGAWSEVSQAGVVSGDVVVYLTTYDEISGDMVAWIKATGKPAVSITINRAAPGPVSTHSPGVGGDIRTGTLVASTSDDVHHFSCFPSTLTATDLTEIAAIVGAT